MMLRHLLWKDSMAIKPLVVAILIGIVAIYAIAAITTYSFAINESVNIFVSFWVLMPNLVALGAPALLVGGEEESGTLSWLRTLPVSWKKVADSKFVAALGAVAVVWIASSLLLVLVTTTLSNSSVSHSTPYADSFFSVASISYLLFFSLLLLICGFITAYLFRSPVAGLIAVVPLIFVLHTLALDAGRLILTGDVRYTGRTENLSFSGYWPVGLAGVVFLAVVWSLQRILACRRLTSSQTTTLRNLITSESESVSAYRPPALVGASRPNQVTALLWQQWRQTGLMGAALTFVVAVFLMLHLIGNPSNSGDVLHFLNDLSPLIVAIGASWLGGLAFYGDSVRRRCAYFADRGIQPTRIWWTRLLYPLVCCLTLVGLVALVLFINVQEDFRNDRMRPAIAVVIVVMFAFGQLVSQWMRRPILTFFAAPAFTVVMSMVLVQLFTFYPTYYYCALCAVPVMLFASWRLAARWLSGRIDFGYHWRVLAYSALAVSVPIVAVWASRCLTTPQPITQWRAEMMATRSPAGADRQANHATISPDAYYYPGYTSAFEAATPAQRHEILLQELASDGIGDHVSYHDINTALNEPILPPTDPIKLHQTAIAVLLKWDRQLREGISEGKYTLWDLELVAEPAEARAVHALNRLPARGETTPETQRLIESIPTSELRYQSRRNGLIAAWKAYQQQPWRRDSMGTATFGKAFAHNQVRYFVSRFRFEQTRSDRFVDRLTRLLLEQLDTRLPPHESTPQFLARDRLWTEASGPRQYPGGDIKIPFGKHWTSTHDARIDLLKARSAAMSVNESQNAR